MAGQRNLARVVGGICDVADDTGGGEIAQAAGAWAACKDPMLVDVVGIDTRAVQARIALDKTREPRAFIADVANIQQVVLAEHTLNGEVPVLRVWRPRQLVHGEYCRRFDKALAVEGWRVAAVRVRKIEARPWRELVRLRPRERANRSLKRPTHAILERVIENAIARANGGAPAARRIPRNTDSRHDPFVVVGHDTPRHAGITGKQQSRRCVGVHLGWRSRRPFVHAVPDIHPWRVDLIAKAVVERQVRCDAPLILRVTGHHDVAQSAVELSAALEEHYRIAGEETGKGVAERKRGKHKEAIRRDAEQEIDLVPGELAAEFEAVTAARHRDGIAELIIVLVSVLRSDDRIPETCIATDDQIRRA